MIPSVLLTESFYGVGLEGLDIYMITVFPNTSILIYFLELYL